MITKALASLFLAVMLVGGISLILLACTSPRDGGFAIAGSILIVATFHFANKK